jgi:hypothetical protein
MVRHLGHRLAVAVADVLERVVADEQRGELMRRVRQEVRHATDGLCPGLDDRARPARSRRIQVPIHTRKATAQNWGRKFWHELIC